MGIIEQSHETADRQRGTREGVVAHHRNLYAVSLELRLRQRGGNAEELEAEVERMQKEPDYCGEYSYFLDAFDRQKRERGAATAD